MMISSQLTFEKKKYTKYGAAIAEFGSWNTSLTHP
jgi:hypothetical protein